MINKYFDKFLYFLLIFLILIDQSTKQIALNYLNYEEQVKFFIFNLFLVHNESSMFLLDELLHKYNILNENSGNYLFKFKIIWFGFIFIFLLGFIWVINQPTFKKNEDIIVKQLKIGLFLIVAGILGNAIDRIFRTDGVVDFIKLEYKQDFLLILNIADIWIWLGELFLVFAWLFMFYRIYKKIIT